jgi:hypothetical protein
MRVFLWFLVPPSLCFKKAQKMLIFRCKVVEIQANSNRVLKSRSNLGYGIVLLQGKTITLAVM